MEVGAWSNESRSGSSIENCYSRLYQVAQVGAGLKPVRGDRGACAATTFIGLGPIAMAAIVVLFLGTGGAVGAAAAHVWLDCGLGEA